MIRSQGFQIWTPLVLGLATLAACTELPVSSETPELLAAKGGGPASVTVQAATPAFGRQGDAELAVTISGSGFDAGSQARWERGGTVDPKISVISTQFVSSTQLVATIAIAADAEIAYYDVAVTTSGGRKGIGTEKFEVTTANLIPELSGPGNSSEAWGINGAGQIVGRSRDNAFYFDPATGIEHLGPGRAMDVNDAATLIVGANSTGIPSWPLIWTGGSGNWSVTQAATNCLAGTVNGGAIRAITPSGALAGGRITVEGDRKKTYISRPVLWNLVDGSCRPLPLPAGRTQAFVEDVNEAGIAVGAGIVWYPDGSFVTLAPLSAGNEVRTYGINEAGSLIVGSSGGRATYWAWSGTAWSVAIPLDATPCGTVTSWASDVNDAGLIVGQGCDSGAWYWRVAGGAVVESARLPGLGPKGNGNANALNDAAFGLPSIVGRSGDRAVYWIR